jgi:hypothetical protein
MRKLTTKEFLEKFQSRYKDMLNLDMSDFVYKTSRSQSITKCLVHNEIIFNSANNLLQGIKRCKKCKSECISKSQSYNIDTFLQKSKRAHGEYYCYKNVVYKGIRKKVKIICPEHGEFEQYPQNHWQGAGCSTCGYKTLRKSIEEFVQEANKIHNNRYDYSMTDYVNNYTPVKVKCIKHGEFEIKPISHTVYQRGCPLCYPGNRSWVESEWLTLMNVPEHCRQKTITIKGKRLLVDGIVGNTVYEFWGDFWHGNPEVFKPEDKNGKNGKLFKELYKNTMQKRTLILEAGFKLVEIWENDFKNKKIKIAQYQETK